MKHIIICSDGTGNTAIKGRGTNVFKLYEAVDIAGHRVPGANVPEQIALYDDGVGTESFVPLKVLGGMAGWGLSRNVKKLYTEIARVYAPGDKLFLFGFSRGAFTVRTLAGLITSCGIVDIARFADKAHLDNAVGTIYRQYRRRYRTALGKLLRGDADDSALVFAHEHCVRHDVHAPGGRIEIEFIGVWDTVDAVGLPFHISDVINSTIWRFKFRDNILNPQVKRACHALALDEERHSFAPVLWQHHERIEQVWFSGVHSNVGGGYPRQGMSLVALDWMMERAAAQDGVRFLPHVRSLYRELQNVDDKLYDPRSGVGIFYRWKPRDVNALCRSAGIQRPKVHLSAIERATHGTAGYAPAGIPPDCEIVETTSANGGFAPLSTQQCQGIRQALSAAHTTYKKLADLPLLDELALPLLIGRVSYYLFLVTVLWAVWVFGSSLIVEWTDVNQVMGIVKRAALHVGTSVVFWSGLGIAYALAWWTDGWFTRVCSSFWHKTQRDLKRHFYGNGTAQAAQPQQPLLESIKLYTRGYALGSVILTFAAGMLLSRGASLFKGRPRA